jgi:hypothetical protein
MVAALTKLIFDNGIGVCLIIILDKPMVTAKALKDNQAIFSEVTEFIIELAVQWYNNLSKITYLTSQ